MGVEGEEQGYRGFIPGVRYLLDISQGRDPYPEGKKVVVVGGGNVAIDCVRSSFRIGKEDVNLVYRRTIKEMPADPVEIHDAEEEKVKFHYLCNPTRIIAQDGQGRGGGVHPDGAGRAGRRAAAGDPCRSPVRNSSSKPTSSSRPSARRSTSPSSRRKTASN